jgi:hypothetical protein
MEFGLKELDFLWNTVNEIAFANNIPIKHAVKKFLRDVEQQYDNKLGFETRIESLRDEVNRLNQEQTRLRTELLLQPMVGPKLVKLTQMGISEQDVVNIAAWFEKYVAGINRRSFVSELDKYGGLKLAIQKLTKESDRLRKELGSLQTQSRDLSADNQRMLSSLVDSRQTFDFLRGSIDSLRNGILGLVSIAAFVSHSSKMQFDYLHNLKLNYGGSRDGFVSLTKACNGEDSVSIQEIKKEVIKAIEVMQSKLDVNDTLSQILSNARLALMEKDWIWPCEVPGVLCCVMR